MTVIAYRDNVLACDSLWTVGDFKALWHTKIIRLSSGALFGDSGDADSRALIALVDECLTAEDLPTADALAELRNTSTGLLILPDGAGWLVGAPGGERPAGTCGVFPAFTGRKGFAAIGCGEQLAIGAMEMGASAVEAVKVACKRNAHCGLPVHTLEL